MNVTVAEVLAGAEARAVPLGAECVGYLVLAAADQIGPAPRRVAPSDLLLLEDGTVRVAGGQAADAAAAEADLRSVLDALLVRSSAPTSGLLRASRREAGSGVAALVRELETALIPVNRAAAKRALARLERETQRALESGRISVAPPAPPREEPQAVAAQPEPSVAPAPSVASVPAVVVAPVRHEPVVAEQVALAAAVEADAPAQEHTIIMTEVEPREHTVALPLSPAPIPVEPAVLAETRPEPVVVRRSTRPPAPALAASVELPAGDPIGTEPLPQVTVSEPPMIFAPEAVPDPFVVAPPPLLPPNVTPVLGTRVAADAIQSDLASAVAESAVIEDDDKDLFEVIFEPNEQTILPDDDELIYVGESEETDPCPPLDAESMLPPAELAPAAPVLTWTFEPMQPVSVEPSLLPSWMTAVPEAESLTPPPAWMTAVAEEQPLTPPPRVALPEPRPSDVEDLLNNLAEVTFAVDELRSGLKLLAGMDPTPAPPTIAGGE